jgi:hypothetical protein
MPPFSFVIDVRTRQSLVIRTRSLDRGRPQRGLLLLWRSQVFSSNLRPSSQRLLSSNVCGLSRFIRQLRDRETAHVMVKR